MAEARIKVELDPSEEIEMLVGRIDELKKEIDAMEEYKIYKDMADKIALVKKAFVEAGFTDEEAMKMIIASMKAM